MFDDIGNEVADGIVNLTLVSLANLTPRPVVDLIGRASVLLTNSNWEPFRQLDGCLLDLGNSAGSKCVYVNERITCL